jgi:hypothetical protein
MFSIQYLCDSGVWLNKGSGFSSQSAMRNAMYYKRQMKKPIRVICKKGITHAIF